MSKGFVQRITWLWFVSHNSLTKEIMYTVLLLEDLIALTLNINYTFALTVLVVYHVCSLIDWLLVWLVGKKSVQH